jgi:hypothetical protein
MVTHIRGQDHAEYLKGDSWKCSSSPSGAHHWILGRRTICKYCLTVEKPQAVQLGKDTVTHPAVK